MDFRPYVPADRSGLEELFRSQALTVPGEADSIATHLILQHDDAIVGSVGLSSSDPARLHWIVVRRDLERNGLGRFLLMALFRGLAHEAVILDCPLSAVRFFEKQGFHAAGPALHTLPMYKKLKVCP